MGIRFLCPNGHKLNVKAFLAGKRGICPHCDATFLVPAVSGNQATAVTETVTQPDAQDAAEPISEVPAEPISTGFDAVASTLEGTQPSPPVPNIVPPPVAAPQVGGPQPTVGEYPAEVWYVRAASGEQFGPASSAVMQQWVAEGRVAVDCWVWRTGWPEWKTGGQAITFLNGPPPEIRLPEPGPTVAPEVQVQELPGQPPRSLAPELTGATVHYQTTKRSRRERARKVTFFLGGLVLLLLVILIGILIRNS